MDRVPVGVAAIIVDGEGRYLLTERLADKHGKGTLCFPGGLPEEGESPEAAVIRELREETGIVVDHAQALGVWTYDRWDDHGVHYVTLYFLVDHGDQLPQRTEPHKQGEWEWLTRDDAFKRPLFKGVGQAIAALGI